MKTKTEKTNAMRRLDALKIKYKEHTYTDKDAVSGVGLFLLFYPVLSGQPVSLEFVENGLRWLTGWVLVL